MSHALAKTVGFVGILVAATSAYAQRGFGDAEGVARQAVRPEVTRIEGKLMEIKTGVCELTTGRAGVGTHLILQTAAGTKVNLHLGPAKYVRKYVDNLQIGQTIVADAFHTDKMPSDHQVAVRLILDNETIVLRAESLRPMWAGGGQNWAHGGGGKRGFPGRGGGRGYGRGYGYGFGHGQGYGYRWGQQGANVGRFGYRQQAQDSSPDQVWATAEE